MDAISQLLLNLRPEDAERVDEWFTPDQSDRLLQQIIGTPRPIAHGRHRRSGRRGRRSRMTVSGRVLLVAAAAAVIAVMVVAMTWNAGGPATTAQAAVVFTHASDGSVVATVTDPRAARTKLDAEFAAHGLHISVTLVPVSPSLVGTIIYISDNGGRNQIRSLSGGSCVTGGGGCPIGLKIPSGFKGQGYVTLGRAATANEAYESTASAFAPGEALHCSGLFGAEVSAALPELKAHGLAVAQWRVGNRVVSTVPSNNYIWQIDPVTTDKVRIWTEPTQPSPTAATTTYNAGCK